MGLMQVAGVAPRPTADSYIAEFSLIQSQQELIPMVWERIAIWGALVAAVRAAEAHMACHVCGSAASVMANEKVILHGLDGETVTCGDLEKKASDLGAFEAVCLDDYRVYADFCECAGSSFSCPICPDGSRVPFPGRSLPEAAVTSTGRKTCGSVEERAASLSEHSSSRECLAYQSLASWCLCPSLQDRRSRELRGCQLCPGSSVGNPSTPVPEFGFTCGDLGSKIVPSYHPSSFQCALAQQAGEDNNCCLALSETDPPVDPPTEPPVAPPTEPPVDPPTEPPVDPPTEPPVDPPTEPPVDPPTEPPVDPPTEPPVDPPTEPPVDPPTEPPVDPPTEPPVDPPTEPPVDPPTEPPVDPPTEPPVDPPTEPPVDPPTDVVVEPPFDPPVDPPTEPPVDTPTAPPTDPMPTVPERKTSRPLPFDDSRERAGGDRGGAGGSARVDIGIPRYGDAFRKLRGNV